MGLAHRVPRIVCGREQAGPFPGVSFSGPPFIVGAPRTAASEAGNKPQGAWATKAEKESFFGRRLWSLALN